MRSRVLLEWLLVAGFALAAVLFLVTQRIAERADNAIYDMLARARPALPSDVVIVGIDAASLAAIGPWPWPRGVHAALLDRLAAAHTRAIGYDVLFVDPGRDDAALARAIGAAGNVVLPMHFGVPGINGAAFEPQIAEPAIGRAARATGHADFVNDRDGIVRRVSLLGGGGAATWPQFAEQIYRIARGRPSPAFARTTRGGLPDGFALSRPILLPFSGGAGHHPAVSFVSALRGEIPRELLAGHVLLVGATASGSGDQYPVPSGAMPGVEIQANVVDALLAGRAIAPARRLAVLALALAPLCVLLAGLLLLPPRFNVALGLALILGIVATSAALLLWRDLWVPPSAGLIGLIVVYPLWAWRRLEAANAYMLRELGQLRGEGDELPGATGTTSRRRWFQESIARQADLLHEAIGRVRTLRRFFADSLRGLPDATLVLDGADRVVVANKEAEALFGPVRAAGPDGKMPSFATLMRALAPGDGGTAVEELRDREVTTIDGRVMVVRIVPLRDARDARVGTIARLTDITAIRLATRQRENALQLLTHDMRSPQASILALLHQPAESEATLHDQIAGYARRTLALADDFVQLARAETAVHAEELLDLAMLLVEAVDDQWPLANRKRIALEIEEDEREYLVRGDRALLGRMLINLIGNAVKYSDAGTTVTCSLDLSEPAGDPATVMCRIADQGRGIPAAQLGSIFKPFHRVPEDRRASTGGAGLGLAFVETVVARHGGAILCDSVEGQGTTFTIRLPAAGASAAGAS